MLKLKYPKPNPRGRPRVCDEIIAEIRELRFIDKMTYSLISYELQIHPATARAYCVGKWKDYIPISSRLAKERLLI
jgi:hypothetical protein